MVRSADASPCRQRDDTFASASPSSPAGGGAANVVSALTTPPNLTTSSSRLGPAPSLDLATPPSSDVNASPHLPAAPAD